MNIKFSLFKFAIASLLLGSFVSNAALLEEVIVTAQKREQDLSDVGISITALSGDQLRNLGFDNTGELDDMVPGLMITDYGGGNTTQVTVRGSSQLDFADHHEPPVVVYIDNSYNSYVGGVGANFFDLERVEVLRGPQGTLFGRNATGGVVHLISNQPTQEKEGYLELTGGDFGQIRVEGAIGGGISDTTSGRLSFSREKDDGYQENTLGDDVNDTNNISLRGQLLFEPSSDLSVHLNARYAKDDTNGQGYDVQSALNDIGGIPGLPGTGLVYQGTTEQQDLFCALFLGPPFPLVPGATDCFGYTEPNDGDNTVSIDEVGFYKRTHWGFTSTIEWQLQDNLRLVSITDYQDFEKNYFEDTDSTPAPLFTFQQMMDSNQLSQEFQLHGESETLTWVAGLYYLNIDSNYDVPTNIANCCLLDLRNTYSYETESYAVFLQGEFEISEQFSVTAGFRWTEDEKDLAGESRCFDAGLTDIWFPGSPPECELFFGGLVQVGERINATTTLNTWAQSRSEGEWSGLLQADWRPNDDTLVYVKYSRGNKAGGYNAGAAMLFLSEAFEFNGEILKSFEVGLKATLFDGKARLNASAFSYDYENFQNFSAQGINLIVFNNDAENTGAEIELIANPTEGLEIILGMSLQDATSEDMEFGGVIRDRVMPNAPDQTFNGLVRYEWPVASGSVAAQLDFNYADERSVNGVDHPALIVDDFLVANARLGYITSDGKWEASVFVKNFTDEDYVNTSFDLSTFMGTLINVPNPPRWYGVTVRYNLF